MVVWFCSFLGTFYFSAIPRLNRCLNMEKQSANLLDSLNKVLQMMVDSLFPTADYVLGMGVRRMLARRNQRIDAYGRKTVPLKTDQSDTSIAKTRVPSCQSGTAY